jgi:hypothetical protein
MFKEEGRPQDVYCNGWRPKEDNLKHEVMLTEFLLPFMPAAEIVRGPYCDRKILADAELTFGDHKFYIEMDTGTVDHKRQQKRWAKCYSHVGDYLLVVTSSTTRMKNLIRNAAAVHSIALFTTFAQACEHPFGEIWTDCHDQTVAIPEPKEAGC